LDEGEEVEGELLVAGADAAESFDSLEEVLHAMAELVEAPVPTGWVLAVLEVRDAGTAPGVPDSVTESLGIVALVGHQPVSRRDLDPVRAPDVGWLPESTTSWRARPLESTSAVTLVLRPPRVRPKA
jgi:hypothetical protein